MPGIKKRKTPAENAAQFARTTKKESNKWRGKKAGQYVKYKKKKKLFN